MNRCACRLAAVLLLLTFPALVNAQVVGPPQQITPDGRTQTTVTTTGLVTNVSTSTLLGTVGFNSFSFFNVGQGNVVNLLLPNGSVSLVNLVQSQANVWGILNSVKDGHIGGNVLFASPNGMVVGSTGVVNVGALTVATPTKNFLNSVIDANGQPSATATAALQSGLIPISPDGLISVQGKINAATDVRMFSQSVNNAGTIASGATFATSRADFSDVVNVTGVPTGAGLVQQNGTIKIVTQGDVQNSGTIASNGGNGVNAGAIDIHAGGDINLANGSLL